MTRGTASPSHDQEHPTTGVPVVRPTFAQPSTGGFTSRFAKILVILLALAFVVASLAFIIQLSNAGKEPASAPGTPAIPAAGAAAGDVTLEPAPDADAIAALLQASPSPAPSASLDPLASPGPSASVDPLASPDPLASGDPGAVLDPLASADPSAAPIDPAAIVDLRMPFVPVVSFWSTKESISKADLVDALTGGDGWNRVLIPTGDRAAIEEALGITIANRVEEAEPAAIERVVKSRKARNLGIVRASDLTYRVRALGINDRELVGNDRIRNLDNWPLVATIQGPAGSAWSQRATWTLVAGGDSFTDRGIYERVVNRKKGLDYPFAGGTARVTGHYCCGPFVDGYEVPSYTLGGPKGIVRDMTKDADLAIVNHESPIPDDWVFHLHGFIFTGKPALTEIFVRAGIDWMSLANNHVKDAGTDGIMDTRKNLDRYGIKYAGAGKNLQQARQFSVLDVNGLKVALISCTSIINGPGGYATDTSSGSMPCRKGLVNRSIREAREKADVVIVYPHWGAEYNRSPVGNQRSLAAAWSEAGADLILGAHSHVAGAIEEVGDTPIFYSLGNFIFDQNWRTETMESVLLEATFQGDRIVQLRLHPFLTHDQAQPNFLNPATDDGKALLKAIRRVSLMDW
jgi:hypothetical protein